MPRRIIRYSQLTSRVGRSSTSLQRGSPRQLGYDSAWQRIAERRRRADSCLCQACLEDGQLTTARDVDHIIPLHVRPDWRLELHNTQVLCRLHHRRKTEVDNRRYGSSTAAALTAEQHAARRAAQQLKLSPRDDRGGSLFWCGSRLGNAADPALVRPRIWREGE